jgi:hypothetical protein
MKFARVAFCVCALLCAALTASAQTIDFNKDRAGEPPKGFSTALTGQGKAGVWVVTKDDASPNKLTERIGLLLEELKPKQ